MRVAELKRWEGKVELALAGAPKMNLSLFAEKRLATHLRGVTGPFRLPLAPSTGRE